MCAVFILCTLDYRETRHKMAHGQMVAFCVASSVFLSLSHSIFLFCCRSFNAFFFVVRESASNPDKPAKRHENIDHKKIAKSKKKHDDARVIIAMSSRIPLVMFGSFHPDRHISDSSVALSSEGQLDMPSLSHRDECQKPPATFHIFFANVKKWRERR